MARELREMTYRGPKYAAGRKGTCISNFLIGAVVLGLSALCVAGQSPDRLSHLGPNFSGTWAQDTSSGEIKDLVWFISHNGAEIKIRKSFRYKNVRKGNKFTVYADLPDKIHSGAILKDDDPVNIVSITELKEGPGPAEMKGTADQVRQFHTSTFRLSPDGNRLIINTSIYRTNGSDQEPTLISSKTVELRRIFQNSPIPDH